MTLIDPILMNLHKQPIAELNGTHVGNNLQPRALAQQDDAYRARVSLFAILFSKGSAACAKPQEPQSCLCEWSTGMCGTSVRKEQPRIATMSEYLSLST